MSLGAWLRAKPYIVAVRLDGDDARIVKIASRQHAVAERAIVDMRAQTIEGLDGSGAVVRTWSIEQQAAPAERKPRKETEWPDDPTAMLARVITLALDAQADRLERIFQASFAQVKSIADDNSERLGDLETQWVNMLTERAESAEEAAAAAEQALAEAQATGVHNTNDKLVGALTEAAVRGALTGHDDPKNGAGKHA